MEVRGMYFPYLRGRQFELIALRELVEYQLIGKHIYPVIEPVKLSSTLTKTLEIYKKNDRNLTIIMNPCVGNLDHTKLTDEEDKFCKSMNEIINSSEIKKAFHLSKFIPNYTDNIQDLILIAKNRDTVTSYNDVYSREVEPLYTLMLDESDFRRTIRNKHRVLLSDNFRKQEKNANYENADEFYTRDHLYYQDDGYVGFSDFSIVGDEYTESGFAPYAVAIHIVYFDDNKEMRVRHFVSDTNEDYSDTTGKFHEALEKLIKWNKEMKLDTHAMKIFQKLYDEESYPGLGTVKKLSIMHHIELVSRFLDEQDR